MLGENRNFADAKRGFSTTQNGKKAKQNINFIYWQFLILVLI